MPISRTDSSGSAESMYSFSLDSVSTSPPPVEVETPTGFQEITHKSMLKPRRGSLSADSVSGISRAKDLLWSLYTFLPFIIILVFGFLLLWEKFDQQLADNLNGLYRPNLPSSFGSESGVYDNLGIEFYDLNDYKESANGWQHHERVLFCVPLRDASQHLPMFFNHMRNLTYPHNLIDLAFLISDTTDSTIKDLKKFLKEIQSDPNLDNRFGRINIYEKDFGQVVGQTFSDRHGFALQGPRRKLMAIARNWLLSTALRPDHSWVYWRDIDVETCPGTIIEDLMHHNKDVIVPNVWRPLPDWLDYEQPYDLNSWQESEGGIELLDRLDEDAVIVEGYAEYATWRPHLLYLRDPNGDPEVEMELDGIGGVSILAKASVFKSGGHFPLFSFQKHAETELFGKLCKTMGYSVIGLPHYTIWHIYEPSADDLKHMEWMAKEEQTRFEKLKLQKVYDRTWKLLFEDVSKDWDHLKFNVFKNTDLTGFRSVDVDWNEVDEYLQEINDQTINYEHFISEEQEVRNYDAKDPAKFIYNKYSLKKSEIDLRLKLNEFDKQKQFMKSDDLINYGINKGEDLFGSFPISPYLSGKNPKSMRFVKFKKNELPKFDEDFNEKLQEVDIYDEDEDEVDPEADVGNVKQEVPEEPVEQIDPVEEVKDTKKKQEIKQDDQLEPSHNEQKLKSKENIRQDAMALALLKQKLAKEEIESINQREKIDSLQNAGNKKINPKEIQKSNEKKLKKKVLERQQDLNALTANKKRDELENNVNLNKQAEPDSSEIKLAKIQEEVELINSINDERILEKIKQYENDKILNDISEKESNNKIADDVATGGRSQKESNDKLDTVKGKLDKVDAGGLVDDINIGGSKEKLAGNQLQDDIVPKKKKPAPILE